MSVRRGESFQDYLRVGEAAALLGVSPGTLRNWGRAGKIREHRHPVNGYRLFLRDDLEALLAAVEAADDSNRPDLSRPTASPSRKHVSASPRKAG